MPLPLRVIEPISLGRKHVGFTEASNLDEDNTVESKEECANRTLSNIIRQLASLGKFAFDIFDEIEAEICVLNEKAKRLYPRVNQLDETIQVMIMQS